MCALGSLVPRHSASARISAKRGAARTNALARGEAPTRLLRRRRRVERILRRPATEPVAVSVPLEPALEGIDPLELGTNALIRLLFERRLAWLTASGKAPSFSELRALLEVQRRLAAAEALETLLPGAKTLE